MGLRNRRGGPAVKVYLPSERSWPGCAASAQCGGSYQTVAVSLQGERLRRRSKQLLQLRDQVSLSLHFGPNSGMSAATNCGSSPFPLSRCFPSNVLFQSGSVILVRFTSRDGQNISCVQLETLNRINRPRMLPCLDSVPRHKMKRIDQIEAKEFQRIVNPRVEKDRDAHRGWNVADTFSSHKIHNFSSLRQDAKVIQLRSIARTARVEIIHPDKRKLWIEVLRPKVLHLARG